MSLDTDHLQSVPTVGFDFKLTNGVYHSVEQRGVGRYPCLTTQFRIEHSQSLKRTLFPPLHPGIHCEDCCHS
ncbi:hypothetical protein JTE90_025176 [Oedothorax gibbosus]|uniref:Uncharacterized protein n=1 Tax=Oedothorax gibbosus TaxID=931172 RepID=A0AAV6UJ10_9ARAC|nr:hypothetical protein JTE90_025176 [Oedothorax gibbosus]